RLVNVAKNQDPADELVVIAHEIGHFQLHHDPHNEVTLRPNGLGGDSVDSGAGRVEGYSPGERKEVQADIFADEFLCPSDWLREAYVAHGKRPQEIAAELGLPVVLVSNQLARALLLPSLNPANEESPIVDHVLDDSQKIAVTWDKGPLLVDAGPGTGKTRTLVHRIKHLLGDGSQPGSFLALTFSNKAAEEMRERLSAMNADAAIEMWVSRQYQFFHWHLAFPDVFQVPLPDKGAENDQAVWNGGFDVVLGNPPWVRQELLKLVKPLLSSFHTFSSSADSSVLFIERSVQISSVGRYVGILTPNKWFRAGYAEKLRIFLREHTRVHLLIDFGHSHNLFPEQDTFPAAIVLEPVQCPVSDEDQLKFVRAHDSDREKCSLDKLVADQAINVRHGNLRTERWQLGNTNESELLDRLMMTGQTLATYAKAMPLSGLKTGMNDAFYISTEVRNRLVSGDPSCEILIKRFLRGRDIKRWTSVWANQWHIVIPSSQNRKWPWSDAKDEDTAELIFAETHPCVHDYLKQYEEMLRIRSDRGTFWWELRSCDYYELFDQPKIVVQCIAYFSRFALDNDGQYVNNKILFIPSGDLYLLGILNSRVSWWIINRTFQHMKDDGLSVDIQFLMSLPIPHVAPSLYTEISETVKSLIAKAYEVQPALEIHLNQLVLEAFQLSEEERTMIDNSLPLRDPIAILTAPSMLSVLEKNDVAVAHPWPVEMPQQAQNLPNPLEELSAVANAAWETPLGVSPNNVALFTLIEVMRLIGGAIDSERVRVAANLVRRPATAAAFLDEAQAVEWVRVVGQDARPLPSNVIQISQFQQGTPDLPWADAVRQLKGSGAIVVDSNGKWSASSKLQLLPEQDWIRGRAAVAVQLLSAIEPVVAERKVLAFIRSVEDGTARRAVS
ncbi:MAG: UvrD-helicase domain-containing protein, partial [Terracidiphilus sp.]